MNFVKDYDRYGIISYIHIEPDPYQELLSEMWDLDLYLSDHPFCIASRINMNMLIDRLWREHGEKW